MLRCWHSTESARLLVNFVVVLVQNIVRFWGMMVLPC